jgi:hypothetical protein
VLGLAACAVPVALKTYSLTLTLLWTLLACAARNTAVSNTEEAATLALMRFDDVRAVGPLVDALDFRVVGALAATALIRLLPRLTVTDAELLSPAQRARLNKAMQRDNTDLTLAILKAYTRVGDATAVVEVQKLANIRGLKFRIASKRIMDHLLGVRKNDGDLPKSEMPRIAAAAEECLPFLRQSTEQRRIEQELLRAADGAAVSPDILLRSAAPSVSATPSDELLRPDDGPG